MKVLFVSSGNSKNFDITPFIRVQGEAIRQLGVDVEYFLISGKGIKGYLQAGLSLRKYLKNKKYDVIHAHYTLSGWSAVIGNRKIPIVLSLMGDDAYGEYIGEKKVRFSSKYNTILTYLIQPFISQLISKSKNIEKFVFFKKKSSIIPNGVNLNSFQPIYKSIKDELGLSHQKKHILFLGNKNEIRKNFQLVNKAVDLMQDTSIELINPYPISQQDVPKLMNAADVIVLASFAEGSPNVIKEAMSCNCPIVSTDVGDVQWVMGNTKGCFITSFKPEDVAEKIKKALDFGKKTDGRERIIELGLDSETVAKKIIDVYHKALNK